MKHNGWIGVDLDGTLAEYFGWKGIQHIGEPISAMKSRVDSWLADGQEVRIMTARVCSMQSDIDRMQAREAIRAWTIKHFNREIVSTSEKDFHMINLYDDRCVQVILNTGEVIK